jgi:hypothetical protein
MRNIAAAVISLIFLSACGVKGSPSKPADAVWRKTYPRS